MSKKVKLILAITLLIMIIVVHISYAKVISKEETKAFMVSKEKISVGDTLEMTLNLADIQYNNFKFKLNSNIKVNDVFTKTDSKVNIGIEQDNSENLLIQIDKSEINLDKLTLYYVIPESMKVGTKLDLTAQIIIIEEVKKEDTNNSKNDVKNTMLNNTISNNTKTELNNTTNKLNNEISKQNNTTNNVVTSSSNTVNKTNNETTSNNNTTAITYEEKVVEEIKTQIEIVEKQEEQKTDNLPTQQEKTENNNKEEIKQVNNQKVSSNISKVTVSNRSSSTAQTAVYKGSSNNYLANLEIEGVELNTTFSKENSTYFASVENKENINITATKEADSAKVCITGEDSLTEGQNKILISVTAENGDVRYYRVFIENIIGGEDEA